MELHIIAQAGCELEEIFLIRSLGTAFQTATGYDGPSVETQHLMVGGIRPMPVSDLLSKNLHFDQILEDLYAKWLKFFFFRFGSRLGMKTV